MFLTSDYDCKHHQKKQITMSIGAKTWLRVFGITTTGVYLTTCYGISKYPEITTNYQRSLQTQKINPS